MNRQTATVMSSGVIIPVVRVQVLAWSARMVFLAADQGIPGGNYSLAREFTSFRYWMYAARAAR